ncbi:MAG: formylmethanofuran dehydrogenase subunit B [Pirellulaceae bacterium]
MSEVWNHVACPGCGCVCDDITLQFGDDGLQSFQPGCSLGERWFRDRGQPVTNAVRIEGEVASDEEAIDRGAQILAKADYPLIYGLSRSATPGQRAAIALADALGCAIDTTASMCHGPSIMALQEFGEVTCSLGEVRNRADLVIFWGCDPASSHPRHAERYSVHARSEWLPNGRADRTIVLIGNEAELDRRRIDASGTQPDMRIAVPAGNDFETLAMLRALVAGKPVENVPSELRDLVSMMKNCRYGVVFFGLGLAQTLPTGEAGNVVNGRADVAALLQLVAELNRFARFTARRMRLQGNVSGADNVLCWQAGYPFAVDFSRGFPRSNPNEFSASELLRRGDVDACVLIGGETLHQFPEKAMAHLRTIPTLLLDYPGARSDLSPTVEWTTAVYGLHAEGTIYRMDNLPMEVHAMQPTNLPTDSDVLTAILNRLS